MNDRDYDLECPECGAVMMVHPRTGDMACSDSDCGWTPWWQQVDGSLLFSHWNEDNNGEGGLFSHWDE